MKRLFGVITLLFFTTILFAQPPVTEQQAKKELDERGLDEDLIREKLLERGIDIDKIDQNDPRQLLEIEKALEEVVAEIEAERTDVAPPINPNPQPVPEQIIVDSTEAAIENIKYFDQEVDLSEQIIEDFNNTAAPSAIYGHNVFRDKKIKLYRQSDDVKPPESYILGVGDIVAISIWGVSQEGAVYEINNSGFITPSRMPRIYLKGISFGKAKELLRKRYSNYFQFRPEEFEVSINYSRTITVNLVGEVLNFGSFTIPATNTAFNALVASGGPSDIGSVRNIQLIRAGEQPKQIDVYEYLFNPSVQSEFYLQENDYIHVPIAERIVTISGAIKKSFKYELVKGENLKKLIEYAGGFTDNAYKGNLRILRFINEEETIIDLDYREIENTEQDFQLLSGDVIQVRTIPNIYKNYVEVVGAVDFPGRFELTSTMKISDLVERAVLNEYAKTDIAFIQRYNSDRTVNFERIDLSSIISNTSSNENFNLRPKDKLIIFTQSTYVDNANFSVLGAVRDPVTLPYSIGKEIKVYDAILLASGLKPDATSFAYVRRINPRNKKEISYLRVDLEKAYLDQNSPANLKLEPFDQLIVYSKETFTDNASIAVAGAVRSPGTFDYAENFTLKDILTMAGGLKLEASKSRIEVFRILFKEDQPTETIVATLEVDDDLNVVSTNDNFTLAPFDLIAVRMIPEFEFQNVVTIEGEVKYPGLYPLIDNNERLLNIINRAGGLTSESFPEGATLYRQEDDIGFIVVELDEVLKDKKNRNNFILKKGDLIKIPKSQDLVTIKGATKANDLYPEKVILGGKINVAFNNNKNAKWYVEHYAAGVGKDGRKRFITVEHPNGELERTKRFLFFKNYPSVRKGSIITVGVKPPKKAKKPNGEKRERVDWARTAAEVVAQATAVLSLILLIQSTQ